MGVKEVLTLVSVQFNTNKLVQIDQIDNDHESTRTEGKTRTFSIDFSPRKALILLAVYLGVVNGEVPTLLFEMVRTFFPA